MKLLKTVFKICSILLFIDPLFSQNTANVIGKDYIIKSEVLKKERSVIVYLPESYHESDQKYPVLYLFDGQMHFTNAVGIQRSLGAPSDLPEMIIVGVQNKYPRREDLKWGERDKYLLFLTDELIPFIEKKLRTNNDRVLFGWEMGAYFSSYIAFKINLFDGVISSNGAFADKKLIDDYKRRKNKRTKYLYIANSVRDIYTIDGSEDLNDLLKKETVKELKWKYEKFNDESHESLGYLALYHGLKYYYHDFVSSSFHSIKEFESLGGLEYLKKYYQGRGKRYGFPSEIDNASKNNLIWLAWKRDNFKYFDIFMTEFKDVLLTKRYASSYWQNRFGQFYLKYKKLDKAKEHFNRGLEKYTKTAEGYHGLGQVYFLKNNKVLAKKKFQSAVLLAKKDNDKRLDKYQEDLNKVLGVTD